MEYGCRIMRYYYYYRHRDHPQHQDCYNHQECYDYRYVRSTYYVLPPRWMICSLVQSPVRQQGPGLWASGGMSVLGRIRASDRRAILYYRYYRRTPVYTYGVVTEYTRGLRKNTEERILRTYVDHPLRIIMIITRLSSVPAYALDAA